MAEFIGDANFVPGLAAGGEAETALGAVPLHAEAWGPVEVMIRPERIVAIPGGDATVERIEYYGHDAVYIVALDGGRRGALAEHRGALPRAGGARVARVQGRADGGLSGRRGRGRGRPGGGLTATDLLVLGAGPAGVGAAYRAARDGHRVTLVERAGHVGGAAASHSVAGVRVDLGSHRLHPTVEPRILAELRALLGDDLQRRPRNGRIRLGGRWIAFPLRPLDLARRLPPAMAAGALRDAALGPLRPGPRADTFEEVLRDALGPTLCERFYFPYARKLWGLDPSELAGEQARRRVAARSPGRLLARALARGSAGKRFFLYPRRGYGQLWEALAAGAADAGAEVLLDAEARRVELRPGGGARHPRRRPRPRGAPRLVDPARDRAGPDGRARARRPRPSPPPTRSSTARWRWSTSSSRAPATPPSTRTTCPAARRRSRASRSRATTATATSPTA